MSSKYACGGRGKSQYSVQDPVCVTTVVPLTSKGCGWLICARSDYSNLVFARTSCRNGQDCVWHDGLCIAFILT